jgi:hypothetical protein
MTTTLRGIAAATLLIVPVLAELVSEPLGDTSAFKLVFAASQLVGWLLLAALCRELANAFPPAQRRGRVAGRLLLAGCAAQACFAVTYGLLELATGEPEASFVLFSLGFLLTTVGGLLRGTELRRAGHGIAGTGLVAAASLGFLAIAVGSDPFHDVFLLTGYAAWALVGAGVSGARREGQERVGLPRVPTG